MTRETETKIKAVDFEEPISLAALRKEINNNFNDRLKDIAHGTDSNQLLKFGHPCQFLQDHCDFSDHPIEISVKKLKEKMKQENHPFSYPDIVNMPDHLFHPIACFQSVTHADCKVILTDMVSKQGHNIVVAIELQKNLAGRTVHSIRSIYPKDSPEAIYKWIVEYDLMEYCDKQKALDWLGKQRSTPVEVTKHIEGHTNVVKNIAKK